MSTDTTPASISVKDAADRAGVSVEYLRKMSRDGEITAVPDSRPLRLDLASLDAWITDRNRAKTSVSETVARRAAHRIATAAPRLTATQKRDLRNILASALDDARTPYARSESTDRTFVIDGEVAA
ncbi:hypothetical protein [Corynebacterium variabile]|uniref:hypothetical protein n=1 Tax=Corynebacterium variabile TaxID=1727 RepID=UPI003FCF202B